MLVRLVVAGAGVRRRDAGADDEVRRLVSGDKDSKLHFLSLLEGTFTPLNASVNEMGDEGFLDRFSSELSVNPVELCLEQGRDLPEGMCYGWRVHPILGASFHSSDIQFFTVRVCQSLHAQLHEQLQRKH